MLTVSIVDPMRLSDAEAVEYMHERILGRVVPMVRIQNDDQPYALVTLQEARDLYDELWRLLNNVEQLLGVHPSDRTVAKSYSGKKK